MGIEFTRPVYTNFENPPSCLLGVKILSDILTVRAKNLPVKRKYCYKDIKPTRTGMRVEAQKVKLDEYVRAEGERLMAEAEPNKSDGVVEEVTAEDKPADEDVQMQILFQNQKVLKID